MKKTLWTAAKALFLGLYIVGGVYVVMISTLLAAFTCGSSCPSWINFVPIGASIILFGTPLAVWEIYLRLTGRPASPRRIWFAASACLLILALTVFFTFSVSL